MRNARKCGCSFNQTNTSSCMGERIRVNQGCSCSNNNNSNGGRHCSCQNSCNPRPCPPRPCPPRPCPPRPIPPRPCPSCEDRCASQYRNCMRNCRWEQDDRPGCGCGNQRPFGMDPMNNDEYYEGEEDLQFYEEEEDYHQ